MTPINNSLSNKQEESERRAGCPILGPITAFQIKNALTSACGVFSQVLRPCRKGEANVCKENAARDNVEAVPHTYIGQEIHTVGDTRVGDVGTDTTNRSS